MGAARLTVRWRGRQVWPRVAPEDDPLAPARGIVRACLLVAGLWLLLWRLL